MSTHFTFYSYYKKEAVELKTIAWDEESKDEQEEDDHSSANDLVRKLFVNTLKYIGSFHMFLACGSVYV